MYMLDVVPEQSTTLEGLINVSSDPPHSSVGLTGYCFDLCVRVCLIAFLG